jgi:hypothetical protein
MEAIRVGNYMIFVGLRPGTSKMAYYAGGNTIADPAANTYNTTTWNHLGITVNTSTGVAKAYLNGVLDATSGAAVATSSGSGTFVEVGYGTLGGAASYSGGLVADFAWWNVQLTALEFLALSRGVRPNRIARSNILWGPLDGKASPEPDLSGSANNFTLVGTSAAFGPPIAPFTPRWPQFWFPPPPLPSFVLMPQIVT